MLHVGQKCVLLGAVEAVDLINEKDGASAVLAGLFRVCHHLLDLLDSGEHGGKLDELSLGHIGDDLCQRGLPCSRRPPEDDGARVVALNLQAQRLSRSQDVLLPCKFIQRARTHAVRQRASTLVALVRKCLEQTHYARLCLAASYSNMDAATPALSDSTFSECGIVINSFVPATTSGGKPAPSLPMSKATRPVRSACSSGLPLCDEVPITKKS